MSGGMWFQMARGRAMVRKNAMRKARYWQRTLGDERRMRDALLRAEYELPKKSQRPQDLWMLNVDHLTTLVRSNIASSVYRARLANQSWRRYRALHAAEQA
jgi:hypothetical protein